MACGDPGIIEEASGIRTPVEGRAGRAITPKGLRRMVSGGAL
jgi:hypothetical protein